MTEREYQREKIIDKAYEKLNIEIEKLETKLGESTNVETLKEGRIIFKYECMFCDDTDKVTTKIITIRL